MPADGGTKRTNGLRREMSFSDGVSTPSSSQGSPFCDLKMLQISSVTSRSRNFQRGGPRPSHVAYDIFLGSHFQVDRRVTGEDEMYRNHRTKPSWPHCKNNLPLQSLAESAWRMTLSPLCIAKVMYKELRGGKEAKSTTRLNDLFGAIGLSFRHFGIPPHLGESVKTDHTTLVIISQGTRTLELSARKDLNPTTNRVSPRNERIHPIFICQLSCRSRGRRNIGP
jgi:hypothetical protein